MIEVRLTFFTYFVSAVCDMWWCMGEPCTTPPELKEIMVVIFLKLLFNDIAKGLVPTSQNQT